MVPERVSRGSAMASLVYTWLKQLLVDYGVDEEEISLDASFLDDLNLEPLDLGDLFLTIEDEFEFEIPDADARRLLTVRAVVDYIEDLL
jgi:acyl carrier protein